MIHTRVAPTDTTRLPVPPEIQIGSRDRDVAGQWVRVPAAWWDAQLAELGVAGGPLLTEDRDGPVLTRQAIWRLADDARSSVEGAQRLLWHALAWGSGRHLRMSRQRLEAVAAEPARAGSLLRDAAVLSLTDPVQAYELLHPHGHGALRGLGPAFGSKFLYFAGGGAPEHPCLILDSRVAAALHAQGWTSLKHNGGWTAWTYGRYVALAHRWAGELTTRTHRPVAADQIEYWLFRSPRRPGDA